MPAPLAAGDHVTVLASPDDPVEINVHQHAVVTDVADGGYTVGHPPGLRRYGPYPAAKLTRGWA